MRKDTCCGKTIVIPDNFFFRNKLFHFQKLALFHLREYTVHKAQADEEQSDSEEQPLVRAHCFALPVKSCKPQNAEPRFAL